MKIRICLLFCIILLTRNGTIAQNKITGSVKDSLSKSIANSSITFKLNNAILKYTKTDNEGRYTLDLGTIAETDYIIEAKCFGYKTLSQKYIASQTTYNFTLQENVINLKAVNVKHKPVIIVKGDTLNYRTADFANENDRSIGDVLKKMPGINVAESGKITYNNQPISNLYLDGDNLLDDKYNIGTKSIPYKIVTKIQVIDHDQPIKMLQKNNLSNDIAINLVIDKTAKLKVIGNAKLAAGLPERYDENIDLMLFKQQFKFLNNFSLNNIGIDLTEDVVSHNNTLNTNLAENNRPNFQLSTGIGSPPYLPKTRYLFNNAAIINTNNLFKFNAEKQLKTNIYYLYDRQIQNTNYASQITLPTETINFGELQANKTRNQSIYSQLNYIDNASNHYVNNSLTIDYSPNKNNSLIVGLQNPFDQRLNQKRLNLVNNLKYLQILKSGVILNINSYIEKNNQTEFLGINPGINASILNSDTDYKELRQRTDIPGFFTNNYITYSTQKNRLTQSYQAGFIYQNIDFESILSKIQNDNSANVFNNGINNLNWHKFKIYLNPGVDYKTNAVQITIRVPLSLNFINYNNSKTYNRVLVNPYLGLNYQINQENKLNLSYNFNQSVGKIEDIYSGNILRSYRSIIANNIPLPFAKTQRLYVSYRYQKAISMFFASIQSSYTKTMLDNIIESTISNSIQTRNIIPFANNIVNFNVSGSVGKYLVALNTNIGLDAGFTNNSGEQLQNNIIFPFQNKNATIGINANTKFSKHINWSLRSNYTLTKSLINDTENLEMQQLRQYSKLDVTLLKKITLGLSADHIFIHQAKQENLNYIFTDINLKYKWLKIKTDFEFGLNNIGNIKTFSTYFVDANSFTSANYNILGRYAMLRAVFAFN